MGSSRLCDDHRSLATTRYLEHTANRLNSTLRDRAGLVPTLVITLLLLALLGAWIWGRCLLWPADVVGAGLLAVSDAGDLSDSAATSVTTTATPAGSENDSAAACARSTGSVFLLVYVCAVVVVAVTLAVAMCTVPRLRHQLDVVYRLLRADRAGGVQLPLTDVIQVVREGNLAQAERMIRGSNENVSYGTILPPDVAAWEKLQP